MPTITTSDGAGIHCADSGGDGPVVLFVGGWRLGIPWWNEQIAALGGQYRVVVMDPRAYGESANVPHGHRMARHAADIRDLMVALDLRQVTAVGWSLGANALLAYHDLFGPQRLARIAHVDQSPCCLNGAGWTLGFGTEDEVRAFLADFGDRPKANTSRLVDLMFLDPPSERDRGWMVEEMLKMPVEFALRLERDHIYADWRDVAPTVELPVIVMTGRRSRVFPWQSGEWLAERLPDGKQVIFEQSGHCPFLEEPDEFNDSLREFIRQGSTNSAEQLGYPPDVRVGNYGDRGI